MTSSWPAFRRLYGARIPAGPLEFGSLIASISTHKIDIITASMFITEERKKKIDFSDPYFESGGSIIARNDRIERAPAALLSSVDDLAGKKIGVFTGTVFDGYVQQKYPTAQILRYDLVLTAQQRAADVQAVELPYLIIAGILIALALLVWSVRLPELGAENRRAARAERAKHSLWRHRNLVFGVPAICLYLVSEIGIGSTLVNFISMPTIGAMSHAAAAGYVSIFWGGAMAGRFIGALLLRWIAPARLLAAVSIGALGLAVIAITTDGHLAMWCLIAVGLCHSVMFPTIFTLGHRRLGPPDRGGIGSVDHGHRRRCGLRPARRARRSHRLAAVVHSAGGLLRLRPVLRAVGSKPTDVLKDERLV